jgi:hypothetical protein
MMDQKLILLGILAATVLFLVVFSCEWNPSSSGFWANLFQTDPLDPQMELLRAKVVLL